MLCLSENGVCVYVMYPVCVCHVPYVTYAACVRNVTYVLQQYVMHQTYAVHVINVIYAMYTYIYIYMACMLYVMRS